MVYYISKFTIGFIFIISKFFTSTYTQISNPVIYLIQKCISFKYKSIDDDLDVIDAIDAIDAIDVIDKIDIQDDYKQLNTQEICCIIIQNNTDNSDKNKPNINITDKNNNDEKYLSNDRLYGWFIDIEK